MNSCAPTPAAVRPTTPEQLSLAWYLRESRPERVTGLGRIEPGHCDGGSQFKFGRLVIELVHRLQHGTDRLEVHKRAASQLRVTEHTPLRRGLSLLWSNRLTAVGCGGLQPSEFVSAALQFRTRPPSILANNPTAGCGYDNN